MPKITEELYGITDAKHINNEYTEVIIYVRVVVQIRGVSMGAEL